MGGDLEPHEQIPLSEEQSDSKLGGPSPRHPNRGRGKKDGDTHGTPNYKRAVAHPDMHQKAHMAKIQEGPTRGETEHKEHLHKMVHDMPEDCP